MDRNYVDILLFDYGLSGSQACFLFLLNTCTLVLHGRELKKKIAAIEVEVKQHHAGQLTFEELGADARAIVLEDLQHEAHLKIEHHNCPRDESWPEYDAQGIYLCRVCEKCQSAKLAMYRPCILTGYTQADVNEPIEPD